MLTFVSLLTASHDILIKKLKKGIRNCVEHHCFFWQAMVMSALYNSTVYKLLQFPWKLVAPENGPSLKSKGGKVKELP